MYPLERSRRLRKSAALRDLVRETQLSYNDFLVPLFVVEGKKKREAIPSMPGYERLTLDELEKEVKLLWSMGLKAVLLFVKVDDALKDNAGTEALNPSGLMQRAIQTVKAAVPEMVVFTDVALDPYSSFGHDGIVENNIILNDATNQVLAQMALSHAEAGADVVAPSDMMDGRVKCIREALEKHRFVDTCIMSYSAKYASGFYGPFRDVLDSAPGFGDKKTYQMDFGNRLEALKEVSQDIEEGADIVMVKPGIAYLDILREISNKVHVPVAVYQVSGEYAMLKAAAEKGWLDYESVMMEQLIAFKRSGASIIATYSAKEAVRLLS
ncbi:MAG: porphobilinogen synthase [Flavobacteriaceae bacterium]|jgi:porphobilinogen synthase